MSSVWSRQGFVKVPRSSGVSARGFLADPILDVLCAERLKYGLQNAEVTRFIAHGEFKLAVQSLWRVPSRVLFKDDAIRHPRPSAACDNFGPYRRERHPYAQRMDKAEEACGS